MVGGFAPLTGPLDVTVEFYRRRPKTTRREWPVGDIDNYEKAIYDACNELLWEDDDQIVDNANRKRFAPPGEDGYIRLVVRPADL